MECVFERDFLPRAILLGKGKLPLLAKVFAVFLEELRGLNCVLTSEIVSFISHIMTLEPGDVIATGTPAGVAIATGKFLQPGDCIECTIEKLGKLTNTLGQRPGRFYEPLA